MNDDDRKLRDRLFEQLARVGRALASPGRLELLELLAQGEKTVEALAAETGMRTGNTSAHLRALREARLVETRSEGLYVYYRVGDESVAPLLASLRLVATRRLAEVRELTRTHLADGVEPVEGGKALRARVRRGEVTLLDVRPGAEYAAGHLPGARSIPLAELAGRLDELPRAREVVVYCRGPFSRLSLDAAATLRAAGFRARRLAEGVVEWRELGLPLETGDG